VNGSHLTATRLFQWREDLLALSGQHGQQVLLNPARQLEVLDAFGGPGELL
jgi:DNA repair ATPase RecN